MNKSPVFITGIESFIGKVLRQMLMDAEYKVSGIDLQLSPPRPVEIIIGDIRDQYLYNSIPNDATIIHLAAVSTETLCKAKPLEALDVNVAGTINVAKAALYRKCRQFIFASTELVYAEGRVDLPRTEKSAIDPSGIYAATKAMGESLLYLSGLPNVTILRFGITYGSRERNWCAVESIADTVLRGEDVTVGSLRTARRFIHVRDLCSGIMAALGRTGQETFNLAGERLVTLWDVLNVVHPGGSLKMVETNYDSPSIRNPDSTKAREQLGWTPKVTFEDGLREVIEYLKVRKT